MTQQAERFIPVRLGRILELLGEEPALVPDAERFARLARLLESLVQHEFRERRRQLKRAWRPFDAEAARRFGDCDEQTKVRSAALLAEQLDHLLEKANYERITFEEVHRALAEAPLVRIGLHVDLDDFEELVVYRCGRTTLTERTSSWFGLRKRAVEIEAYEQVCLFVRYRGAADLAARGRKNLPFEPGSVCLKLFSSIPVSDIETLFPNVEVRLRAIDRWMLGVPAAAGMIHFLFIKGAIATLGALSAVGVAILFVLGLTRDEPDMHQVVAALLTLGVLLALLFRHWNNFKSKKIRFLQLLSDKLYYRKLDNGIGVLFHLLDDAEESEVKEALLAWTFLARSDEPLALDELDDRVERWLRDRAGCEVDFEEQDALDKLRRFGLVETLPDGRLTAVPLDAALARLRARWDEIGAGA